MATKIVDRYIKHPPAASGPLADGDPLDSGSAHIIHSDVTVLAQRNVRLIGHALGPGDVDIVSTHDTPWADAFDVTEDPAADEYGRIPWTRPGCALNFGPIALAHSRLGASPAGYWPRQIRVVVQAYTSAAFATNLTVMAVLSSGPDTPLRSARLAQTFAHATDLTSGPWAVDLTLDCVAPVRPSEEWRSRATSTGAPALTPLAPAWVWVGWHSDVAAISVHDRVEAVSVFEVY